MESPYDTKWVSYEAAPRHEKGWARLGVCKRVSRVRLVLLNLGIRMHWWSPKGNKCQSLKRYKIRRWPASTDDCRLLPKWDEEEKECNLPGCS